MDGSIQSEQGRRRPLKEGLKGGVCGAQMGSQRAGEGSAGGTGASTPQTAVLRDNRRRWTIHVTPSKGWAFQPDTKTQKPKGKLTNPILLGLF